MVVKQDDTLVVFTGCSHSGILNMIETALDRFPGTRVRAVFGGFHLIGIPWLQPLATSRGEVMRLGEAILGLPIDVVYTGHCTGDKGFRILKEVLGDRLLPFPTGARVEV